jgi:hypothetical protein
MKVLIVYESMYGNTHTVADHIANGLRPGAEVSVVPVSGADAETVAAADLLIVGGPTHAHGMSRPASRTQAVEKGKEPDSGLEIDPDAEGEGLREWFDGLPHSDHTQAAAFDTRIDMAPALTGRASKGIAKRLRHHGFTLVADPESFLVDTHSHLLPDEDDRARAWGAGLHGVLTH